MKKFLLFAMILVPVASNAAGIRRQGPLISFDYLGKNLYWLNKSVRQLPTLEEHQPINNILNLIRFYQASADYSQEKINSLKALLAIISEYRTNIPVLEAFLSGYDAMIPMRTLVNMSESDKSSSALGSLETAVKVHEEQKQVHEEAVVAKNERLAAEIEDQQAEAARYNQWLADKEDYETRQEKEWRWNRDSSSSEKDRVGVPYY
jgi:hypothetical protein